MNNYPTFKVNITRNVEFKDPITLDDISQTVEEYIHEDIDNIVILYNSGDSTENQYFFTKRGYRDVVMAVWMEEENLFYGCKNVSGRVFLDRDNVDIKTEYLSLRSIGMHVNHNFCLIDNIFEPINDNDENLEDTNYKNQLFVLYNLHKGFPSYTSVASFNAGVAQSSAVHCQEGYASKTSILLFGQPATTDYEQNLNEPEQDIIVAGPIEIGPPIGTPPYEPGSPDWPPPDWPPPSGASSSMDIVNADEETGGKKRNKKKRTKKKRKNKKKLSRKKNM